MQSLTVVHGLDELGDGGLGVFEVLVLAGVDLLPFERIRFAALRVMKLSAMALS